MNIKQAYNQKNKTTIEIQDIFKLKYLGQYLFPLPNHLNVMWDKIKDLNIYDAYSYSNKLSTFYILEYDKVPFILITYNHTSTILHHYCTNQNYYEQMMKHFVLFSNFYKCDCLFTIEENLPNL